MQKLIEEFPAQLREALDIGKAAELRPIDREIKDITIIGLGGSGIGGTLVSQLTDHEITVPIKVYKTYEIPAYIDESSLVIASSYSGNTEETLSFLNYAISKGAFVVGITSGGTVEALSKEHDFDIIKIPGGNPPRACLGYSLTQLFYVLTKLGFIQHGYIDELEQSLTLITANIDSIKKEAIEITDFLFQKFPIIYSTDDFEGVGVRFRQQVNENSKLLCMHHAIPEMNHNELVGWRTVDHNLAVLFIRHNFELDKNITRIKICKGIIEKYTPNIREVHALGNSKLENAIYMIHLLDWVSLYLAHKRNMDPIEIEVINHLKSELAKLN